MFEHIRFRKRHAVRGGLALLLALAIGAAPVAGFGAMRRPSTSSGGLASSPDATRVASTVAAMPGGLRATTSRPTFGESLRGHIAHTARGTFVVEEQPDAGMILLGSGHRFDPVLQGEPPIAEALTSAPPAPGEIGSYLVQLRGPARAGQREQLVASGASIFAYVPHHAYLVRMRGTESATVSALPFVRWVGPYQPAYKLSGQVEMQSVSGPGNLVVLLFPDADLSAARSDLQSMGATIEEATDSGRNKILRVTLDMGRVAEVAGRGDVAWVEPWHQPTFDNAIAQWVVQTNVLEQRRVWAMGLHGEGQVVHISDSGIRTSHNAFRDNAVPITTFGQYPTHRKVIAYLSGRADIFFGDDAGASNHGTHVAGTVAGDDSPFAADLRDGHALKAKIFFTDIGKNSTSVFAPSDLNLVFGPAYAGNGGGAARISSNSWGSPVNEYDVQAMTIDQFMSDHSDFLVFFANGNTAGPGTAGSPGTNKNGVTLGNCQNGANANQKSATSSEGPTTDGRLKPTIMAPGQGILSADGAGDTGYKSLTGTSMATPAAAGATALIRQYLTEGWYPTGTPVPGNAMVPSGALLKAMAITSTDNDMLAHNIPDNTVGWGRIKLDNILYFPGDAARTALVDESDGLATGEFAEYEVRVTDPSVPLKITLCWTDHEAAPGAGPKIVNDLDLTVTDPGNTVYLGNRFAAGQSAPAGTRDLVNVEESVRRNTPATGVWKVRVSGASVPFAPQSFAIAVSGGVGAASGIVRLDRQTYGRSDVIEVHLEDLDAAAPVQVTATSTTEVTPEVITLSGSNGVFTASLPTTSFAPQGGDGVLSVSHGDQITVTYNDPNPAGVSSAWATARFDGPVITNVGTQAVGLTQVIAWTTDVLSRSRVFFGTSPALGQTSALDPALVTAHSVTLTGLLPETQYWFDVEATDHGGNATRDDNGGQHYRFATGKQGEILVAVGDFSFTNTSLYTTALVERGWNPAVLAGGTLTSLPVGNRDAGLRSYLAVLWQSGLEQYPPLDDASRAALTAYLDGGGRLAVTGHDIAWALTDLTSGHANAERTAWLANTLHLQFIEDPAAGWAVNQGVPGDPISGAYTAGVAYAPHRQGASGDEVSLVPGTGSGAYTWINTDVTAGNIGFRWENGAPNGNPLDALWGGTPSRLVYNGFEWSHIVDAAARADILDKTVIWLVGRDHPDVTVTSPNGGEVVTSSPVSVSWTESAFGGTAVVSRSLSYSRDGGSSWNLIASGASGSPYIWDVSALPNGSYRVRVEVGDNGTPSLSGRDASNADFTLNRPGGDIEGPVVVAGSIKLNPNPVNNQATASIIATLSDLGHGGANVTAAEFSWGESPMPAGSGHSMSGSFNSSTVNVSANVPANQVAAGERTFWVRGRDGSQWGPATGRAVVVNGSPVVGVDADRPAFMLHPSIPNPAVGSARIAFALPQAGPAELGVYGVRGERVRTLVDGMLPAGRQDIMWDGRDDTGRLAPSGIYFYRLVAGPHRANQKLVFIR